MKCLCCQPFPLVNAKFAHLPAASVQGWSLWTGKWRLSHSGPPTPYTGMAVSTALLIGMRVEDTFPVVLWSVPCWLIMLYLLDMRGSSSGSGLARLTGKKSGSSVCCVTIDAPIVGFGNEPVDLKYHLPCLMAFCSRVDIHRVLPTVPIEGKACTR